MNGSFCPRSFFQCPGNFVSRIANLNFGKLLVVIMSNLEDLSQIFVVIKHASIVMGYSFKFLCLVLIIRQVTSEHENDSQSDHF